MTVVSLPAKKWLGLCDHAMEAAALNRPEIASDLANAAGQLTTCTPPYKGMGQYALFMSFRWDCTAFGLADGGMRTQLAEALAGKARMIRDLLTRGPTEPEPSAAAMPVPDIEAQADSWRTRRDIGG